MAQTPTTDEIERKILDYVSQNVRKPGEVFNSTMAQINVGVPAADFETAMNSLRSKGYIEISTGPFIKVTEAGYKAI